MRVWNELFFQGVVVCCALCIPSHYKIFVLLKHDAMRSFKRFIGRVRSIEII